MEDPKRVEITAHASKKTQKSASPHFWEFRQGFFLGEGLGPGLIGEVICEVSFGFSPSNVFPKWACYGGLVRLAVRITSRMLS